MNKIYLLTFLAIAVSGDTYPAAVQQQGNVQTSYQPASVPVKEKDTTAYSQQIIENPVYDPNLYATFVPQDAVQQYVSQYGGPYGPAAFYPQHIADQSNPAGFSVQSGYEGYLIPKIPSDDSSFSAALAPFANFSPLLILKSLLPLIPKFLLAIAVKIGAILFSTVVVVILGALITAGVCAFTPICTLSFVGLPFLSLRENAKKLTDVIETELTADRVKRAAEFVKSALEKYQAMQHETKPDLGVIMKKSNKPVDPSKHDVTIE